MSIYLSNSQDDDSIPMCLSNSQDDDSMTCPSLAQRCGLYECSVLKGMHASRVKGRACHCMMPVVLKGVHATADARRVKGRARPSC